MVEGSSRISCLRTCFFLNVIPGNPRVPGESELLLFLSKTASGSSKVSSSRAARQPSPRVGHLEENSNCEVKTPEMIELDLEGRLEK